MIPTQKLIRDLQEKMRHGADPGKAAALCGIHEEEVIDFSSNINPWGFAREISLAVIDSLEKVQHYPEPYAESLVAKLAEREQVPDSWIHCGNGGADLIFRMALAMRISNSYKSRQNVLTTIPNFREYRDAFGSSGFHVRDYQLDPQREFRLDEGILREIDSDLAAVLLCNPNNPTGVTIDPTLLHKIRERCREKDVFLILDECFLEFLEPELQQTLAQRGEDDEKLIVLKSFTKMYAIPALRAGWLICSNRELSDLIGTLTPPWQCSGPAQAASHAALDLDPEITGEWRRKLANEKEILRGELIKAGASGITGEANYLFFRFFDTALQARMLLPPGDSVLIRSCANYEGLSDEYFRVAIRSREFNQRLATKLQTIREE